MMFINKEHENFAVEIRMCRAAVNISQKELAEMSGLSIQSIKRLEKKGANPKFDTMNAIHVVFKELGIVWFKETSRMGVEYSTNIGNRIEEGTVQEYVNRVKEGFLHNRQEGGK